MRIASNMVTQKYNRQLTSLESDLNDSTTKVSSGKAITNFSDNTSAAVKAYKIRSDLNKVDSYQANISHADTSLTDSESALNNMEDVYQYAMEKIVEGQNATQSSEERDIIATELRSLQDELLKTLNTNASGTYLFGGTNSETEPFTIDSTTGKLTYNGYVLDDLDPTDLDPTHTNGKAAIDSLSADSRYLDIGLNIQFDSFNSLVKSSAFAYTIQGIDIAGYGTSTVNVDGTDLTVSNNLYDLLGQIATAFESDDYSYNEVDTLYSQFQESSGGITQSITNVGSKQNYLDFMTDRYETQELNLEDKQSEIEDVDMGDAVIQYKTDEVAYNAALQLGASVIQTSIFDYMS